MSNIWKQEAYLDGQREARRHLREVVVVSTEQWWRERMVAYADGHWLARKAQPHFIEGWKSVPPPPFVRSNRVVLRVRLMNVFPERDRELSPLEKEMYRLFHVLSSMSSITFVKASKICFTYEIKATIEGLNMPSIVQFFKQQLVSYILVDPIEETPVSARHSPDVSATHMPHGARPSTPHP